MAELNNTHRQINALYSLTTLESGIRSGALSEADMLTLISDIRFQLDTMEGMQEENVEDFPEDDPEWIKEQTELVSDYVDDNFDYDEGDEIDAMIRAERAAERGGWGG